MLIFRTEKARNVFRQRQFKHVSTSKMHRQVPFMLRNAVRFVPIALVGQIFSTDTECAAFSAHTYPANDPTEDRHVMKNVAKWGAAAVFDGHGGWQVSNYAAQGLIDRVMTKINHTDEKDEQTLDNQISSIFEAIEQDIRTGVRNAVSQGSTNMVKVGSCVLLAFQKGDRLILANCGDCRAILGSATVQPTGHRYVSTRLNRDHNARVALEQLRLQQDHPGENNLVICKSAHACYVKGRLQLTRSLGDLYLKDNEFNEFRNKSKRTSVRYVPDPYSPPYVSHQPDMHHIRLDPQDRFVILATDGVWDYLSDQEAVDIVASCLPPLTSTTINNMSKHSNSTATYYDWWCGVYSYLITGTSSTDKKNNSALEQAAAALLVQRALEIAAAESGMTPAQLRSLPVGNARRNRHDDTTAVVMHFFRCYR